MNPRKGGGMGAGSYDWNTTGRISLAYDPTTTAFSITVSWSDGSMTIQIPGNDFLPIFLDWTREVLAALTEPKPTDADEVVA